MDLTLTLLAETFTLHRLNPRAEIPQPVFDSHFFAITRTGEELSLLLPGSVEIQSERSEPGWVCFKVEGPLEFGQVGILAGITAALAEAGVPVFALSTFDTDYIFVKREQVQSASEALRSAGYRVFERVR